MKKPNNFSVRSRRRPTEPVKVALFVTAGLVILAIAALIGFSYWRPLTVDQFSAMPTDYQTTPVTIETYTPTVVEGCEPATMTSRPYLMSIPSLDINNACMEYVGSGKRAAGQLDDPEDIWRFGWFKRSAAPGIDGQGVYTCHSGYGAHQALCDNLSNLINGAEIILENSSGKKFTYQVVEIKIAPLENVDMAEFQSVPEGHSQGLSIMTCTGDWDSKRNTMKDRLTVRAVMK